MGFTTPCFIRKNTPELRKKLERLGYYKNSPKWTDDCNIIWAYQYSKEKGFDTPHYVIANAFDIPFDKHSRLCGKFIGCGTNEDLFLALAALRDDTDNGQFFVFEERFVSRINPDVIIEKGALLKCCMDKWRMPYFPFHKATVKELIEHFKEKGD
ncbi:hypothetical protein [Bacteroides thetaiotaomicron]|uniref:hypothetical protein n=1 Tax=Bacteroides thetaiotaomicron TaxID=818 RepID=UPI0034A39352